MRVIFSFYSNELFVTLLRSIKIELRNSKLLINEKKKKEKNCQYNQTDNLKDELITCYIAHFECNLNKKKKDEQFCFF